MNLKNIIYALILVLPSYYLGKCDNEDGRYSGLTFTITLNSDGNTFSYGGNTYTKQSNTLNDGKKK